MLRVIGGEQAEDGGERIFRTYRIIIEGEPVIPITEGFLLAPHGKT